MSLRSPLFLPANRLERLNNALNSGTDLVILDLEDGVGAGNKAAARAALTELMGQCEEAVVEKLAVRINPLSSPEGIKDMATMLEWEKWPAMLVLPKIESSADVRQITALTSGRPNSPTLLLIIETATGISKAFAIAAAAPPDSILGYGSADHMAETGGTMTQESLAFGRAQLLNAAATRALPALDGVWLNYRDLEGLATEAAHAKSLGFSGKLAIHPDQVAPINATFTPSAEEYVEALEMLKASERAGGGAFAFNGKMVDLPVLERSKRTLKAAKKDIK